MRSPWIPGTEPSAIYHEPQTNSRKVQGERTGARAWREGKTTEGGRDIFGEAQGGGRNGRARNIEAKLSMRPEQVVLYV